jgi:hypothetical protein
LVAERVSSNISMDFVAADACFRQCEQTSFTCA